MQTIYDMPGHLIRRLQQISVGIFTAEMSKTSYDLTSVQFAALQITSLNPGLDQATLAGMIAYDRATIGAVVDRLVAKGLIERKVSEHDRRARVLRLTELGEKTLADIEPIVAEVQRQLLDGFAKSEDAEQFHHLLKELIESLSDRTRAPLRK